MDASQFAGMSYDELLAYLHGQGEIPRMSAETGTVLSHGGFQYHEREDGSYEVRHPFLSGRIIWSGGSSPVDDSYTE